MAKKEPVKNKGGAPSKWKDEFVEQAGKLALLGLVDEELASFFSVSKATWNNWKKNKPGLLDTLKKNKTLADADMAVALFKRGVGYSHEEEKLFCYEGQVISEKVTKHYPPDTGAAMAFLKNRQRKLWRDKPLTEDGDEEAIPIKVQIVREDGRKE